jgi:lipopolysaccharide export system protein LptA
VWTPKRVLLLAGGFSAFFMAYLCYAHFLGGIDGLPPLPEDYGPVALPTDDLPAAPGRENSADAKLRMAFGDECPEAKDWKIKLELESRNMVIATQDISVEPDGRVKLTPFSVAIFGKDKGDGKYPEINTVRSQQAYLTFDKPVSNIAEMSGRKIMAGELSSDGNDGIYLVNNRRTPQRDDDLSLFTRGPMFYEESRHLIYTQADVRLTDPQSKPNPMTIAGTGMDVYLIAETPDAKKAQPGTPAKSDAFGVSGVERIVLRSDVDMNLWVDSRSGFLGAGKKEPEPGKAPAAPAADKKPEPVNKSKVVILTQGPFQYDLRTDKAYFDLAQRPGPRPNVVTVDRLNEIEGKLDHLQCDHLELQFRRKSGPQAQPHDDATTGLDVENVRATGKEVVLTSDAEILEAHGNDFFYDRRTNLSILKGTPRMWSLKEGNEIEAPELQLLNQQGFQQATALGAGTIKMLDKNTGKRPLEARWSNKLIYGKDGALDLLSLFGDASFHDHEHGQSLSADTLKLWLEPADKSTTGNSTTDQQHRKAHHVDAVGRALAIGPDLRVHDTERLVIWFKDAPPGQLPPAAGAPAPPPLAQLTGRTVPVEPDRESQKPAEAGPSTPGTELVGPPAPAAAQKPKPPMDLSARMVTAHVLRGTTKNDLEKLWCEGAVHVHQDPSTPEEKGIDIRGDTLELTHHVEGNVLAVTGDPGRAQLNQLFLLGPEINIDQTTNEAWINGLGLMRLPSKANLDGSPSSRETELTINWEKRMLFTGQEARFWGGVRAAQDDGRLTCQEMQVVLDRKVSLREGDKGKPPAKVQSLLCDREVWTEDFTRQGTRLTSLKRMECVQLSVEKEGEPPNEESTVKGSGPGTVRMFQLGEKGEEFPGLSSPPPGQQPPPKKKDPNAPKEEEYKLTQVTYQGMMVADNKRGMATFYDHVIVIHLASEDPNLVLDEQRLPADSMYLSCEKLEVLSHKLPDNKTSKEMRAYQKVIVEAREFSGRSDVLKYDESKEQIILEGSEGKPAVLYREKVRGTRRETLEGRKIIYNRITGEFKVEGATGLSGSSN